MAPLLSVIIPTFNSAKNLKGCLESILMQSFDDYEILIMDGISTDNTLQTAAELKDNRIKIYSEKDKGIYDAMNKGIKLASGEWVYFLGSDDRLFNTNVLAKLLAPESLNNSDVLYGNVYSTRFNGIYDGEFTAEKILKKNICHQSIFFRKKIFQVVADFNLKYKVFADWDHNMRWFFNNAIRHTYINEVIANYADGGFSAAKPDKPFFYYKIYNYLMYSKKVLPKSAKLRLLAKEYKRALLQMKMKLLVKLISKTETILHAED